ncbi:uncharacterized protein LOC114269715 [Camellia sinensis]|uniref:uncharacterized protein LOC114269715 n=1 Tax=Camellia sinensis TaxID=4442 RepID=UPI001036757E|nr:uncharacterized protein LOC114269715 [Camellia sinensis]
MEEVICQKYKIEAGAWFPNQTGGRRWSKLWGDIIAVAEHSTNLFQFFANNFQIKVGDGNRVRFWLDVWHGGFCFKEVFPRLFSLSTEKNGSLKFFVDKKGISGAWDLCLRRPLRQWEVEEAFRLTDILTAAPRLSLGVKDNPRWLDCKPGQSFVASLYRNCDLGSGVAASTSRLVWINYVPPKVQFFGWLAWKHKIKTSAFLQRVGVLGEEASTECIFCKSEVESASHVLISCPLIWKVWSGLVKWWGLVWVVPGSVEGLLHWWAGTCLMKAERRVWLAIPLVAMWSIWKHRNNCLFNCVQPDMEELKESIIIRLAIWLKAASKDWPFSINDFLFNISQIRVCLGGRG